MTTSTALVRAVIEGAESEGQDVAALLAHAGLDSKLVRDVDARVPTDAYLRIFAEAEARSHAVSFGATVARALDAPTFGLLGFVVASCPTVREALLRFSRYARLLSDELSMELVAHRGETSVVYGLDGSLQVPAVFEMAIVHLVSTARKGTRGAFAPRRAMFRHRASPRTMARLLHAPVTFGANEDAIHCDDASLDLPLRGSNPALLRILDAHADHVISGLPERDDVAASTRVAIRAVLPRGEPSLGAVAARLGLGGRTLQRRLRERGLTLRTLVDDVRRECALLQLADPAVSVAEVAFSLGFSDPSAFHSAFRRWTGRSPGRRGGA